MLPRMIASKRLPFFLVALLAVGCDGSSDTPDAAFQTNYGWIYDAVNGRIFAGGFDADDQPLPRQ